MSKKDRKGEHRLERSDKDSRGWDADEWILEFTCSGFITSFLKWHFIRIHNISLPANKINWLPDATFLVVIHNPREEYMLIHDID